jgi:hypothetical protein
MATPREAGAFAQSSALRAAELAATSEDVRSRVMTGELELSDTLVRVSNLLDRAERRLVTLAGRDGKRPYTVQDVWAALARDDEEPK